MCIGRVRERLINIRHTKRFADFYSPRTSTRRVSRSDTVSQHIVMRIDFSARLWSIPFSTLKTTRARRVSSTKNDVCRVGSERAEAVSWKRFTASRAARRGNVARVVTKGTCFTSAVRGEPSLAAAVTLAAPRRVSRYRSRYVLARRVYLHTYSRGSSDPRTCVTPSTR